MRKFKIFYLFSILLFLSLMFVTLSGCKNSQQTSQEKEMVFG